MKRITMKKLKKMVKENGGFSINTVGETKLNSGYMVSVKDLLKIKLKDLTGKQLKECWDQASQQACYLGGWLDGEYLYLDASDRFEHIEDARMIGRSRDQIAIYDIANQKSIYLK